jgi:hypothetical protein
MSQPRAEGGCESNQEKYKYEIDASAWFLAVVEKDQITGDQDQDHNMEAYPIGNWRASQHSIHATASRQAGESARAFSRLV